MVTQTGKRKRDKKVDIPPTPPNVTTNDALRISTLIDVDKFFFLLATSHDSSSTTCRVIFIVGSSIVGKHLYPGIDINSLTFFIVESTL